MENVEVKKPAKKKVAKKKTVKKSKNEGLVAFMEHRNLMREKSKLPPAYSKEEIDAHR